MRLGRYEVVRELGKGAMGIVYLAKDPLIGRLVALKTIRPAQHADEDEAKEFQERFIREAQAAGILNHPSIVTVHDIGQDEATGTSFIAMEYVEGQNLKEVLQQGRALSFDQIGDIIAQVAEALDFAHSKGIVHRDVKPANVILLEGNRAKITDFGIAKIASGGANLTTTGQFLGTPNYMAPEQIKGAPVDGRTDIFSLGICLYECLTRRKPFGGDSLTSISYKIVHEPFPPLRDVNPQIPEGFEEVVAQSLAKDPAKRYQRGKDLASALRAVGRGERPVRPEPLLADETVVTRDKVPTIEMPFPQAAESPAVNTLSANRATVAMPQPAAPPPGPTVARPATPPKLGAPKGAALRKTLNGVRAMPLWRRRVSTAVFFGIVGVLLLALAAVLFAIDRQKPAPAKVDAHAIAKVAKERQLRLDGNRMIHEGRVDDAYTKFEELNRIKPGSPYVTGLLGKLSMIRQQTMVNQQQQALARTKFEQGLALFNNKQYADAIPLFEESFHLNPNDVEAGDYLKRAQQEDENERAAKARAKQATRVAQTSTHGTATMPPTGTHGGVAQSSAPVAPATVAITFNNTTLADGYILVKVGADVIAQENLYTESGRAIFRRKRPRSINITREITPKNTDLEFWVIVPSMSINQHQRMPQNFQPGATRHLSLSYDAAAKRVDFQVN